ncbi:MAG: hypothetical protein ACI9A7_000304 [Cyclobacteriaceae bacterium]|jgi:hypothetical protein
MKLLPFLSIIFTAFLVFDAHSQNMECLELRDKDISEIPSLMKKDADAVTLLIEEWKNTCFENEELFRLRIVHKVANERFNEAS